MAASNLPLGSLAEDMGGSLGALERPRRVPVSQGAAESLVISDGGGFTGSWTPDPVPYLVEPMDLLGSRHHEAVCFVGPARTGKTAGLILGWMSHALTNDIGRMMVMHMTEKKAAMLSKLEVDPAIDASERLRALKSPRAHDDTVGLKIFRHGMAVRFAWPSPSEMAATTYRYTAMTDYDRFPRGNNLGGEIFDTVHKRTETLMSRRKSLVESSPERQIEDPHWQPATAHEAPPVGGILGIYNRGDRRRWYWPCPHCDEYFEARPGLALFSAIPNQEDLIPAVRTMDIDRKATEWAIVFCPHCGAGIEPSQKYSMNQAGVWLQDHQSITPGGQVVGDPSQSGIASFWLGGVAAAYQTWKSIVQKYLQGLQQFALTGSEQALESTTYTDQGMPYMSRGLLESSARGDMASMAEDFERFVVPCDLGARFVTIAVDVQGGQDSRFVIQAHAHAPDHEQWVIDRRDLRDSNRPGSRASGFAQADPARHPEDWGVLTDLLGSTYRTPNGGDELRVAEMIVDTGGEDGVTANAYSWWLSLPPHLRARAWLYKGGSLSSAAPVKESTAPTKTTGRGSAIRFLLCNPNPLKDAVLNGVHRDGSGPGKIHLGQWLRSDFWDEMQAEVKMPNGKYQKVRKRNEALDLCAMTRALLDHMLTRKRNRLDWGRPPAWARPLDHNSLREAPESRRSRQSASPRRNRAGLGRDDWNL